MVYLARELAHAGWHVTVFNTCGASRLVNGVIYQPVAEFRCWRKFEVVVIWRDHRWLRNRFAARKVYLWLHDLPGASKWHIRYKTTLTKAIVLSRFHRSAFRGVPSKSIFTSRNALFRPPIMRERTERIATRCIYASCPDRGLECLLKLWPSIRSRVPTATLAVHYGWANIEWREREEQGLPFQQRTRTRLAMLLDQPGIVAANTRLDAEHLWEAFSTAGVWVYPTEFCETSCITAMRAQAAGALPVTTCAGALRETVQWGRKLVAENIYTDADQQAEFVDAVVLSMLEADEDYRSAMIAWSDQQWRWRDVAREWTAEFLK